jgi:hypothetical protein
LTEQGGSFAISTPARCLLRLAADPGLERYEVRVDVRHDIGVGGGMVGLFAAYSLDTREGHEAASFLSLSFTDRLDRGIQWDNEVRRNGGKPPPWMPAKRFRNTLNLAGILHIDAGKRTERHLPGVEKPVEKFEADLGRKEEWRTIRLRVSPDGARSYWAEEAAPTAETTPALIRVDIARFGAGHPAHAVVNLFKFEFVPRGGVGLL